MTIKYVTIQTTIEIDKYHDPLKPWVIVSEENGKILPGSLVERFPSHRTAIQEIRKLVNQRPRK